MKSCNVNVSTTSFLVLTFFRFVHVTWNLMIFFLDSDNSVATVLSGCIFLLFTLSLRGHRNIWLRTIIFLSDWDSSWDMRKLSLRLSVYLLHTILLISPFNFPPIFFRQRWLKFVSGHGSTIRKFSCKEKSTFRQLPTNQPDRKKPPPPGGVSFVPWSRTVCKRTPSKDLYQVLWGGSS